MAKTLEVRIRGDAASALQALDKTAQKLDSVGRRAERFGGRISRNVGLPLAAIAIASTTAQLQAETAFTEMAKTVDAPIERLEALRDRFEELSERTIPKSANELTRIAALGGQLGILDQNLESFTRTVAALDISTDLGAEDAATGLAQLANIMGTSQRNFDRIGSTIVDLGNNLATVESKILEMSLRLAGAGRQIGLTEAQTLSYAGALASLGLEADAGGSAFSKLFATLAKGTATGGRDLERLAAIAGMSAGEFRELFERDASAAILAFLDGLKRLGQQGANTFQILETVGLGERRVTDALLRAANASDKVREAVERGDRAWEQNTALTEEAQKFYDRAGAALERLKNQAVNVAAEFGRQLEPSFRAAIQAGSAFLDGFVRPAIRLFAGLPQPVQATAIGLGALAVAFGPLLIFGGQMLQTGSALIQIFRTLAGVQGLGGLARLVAAGGPLLVGLAAVAAAFIAIRTAARSLTSETRTVVSELGQVADKAATASAEMARSYLRQNAVLVAALRQQVADAQAEVDRLEARGRARQLTIGRVVPLPGFIARGAKFDRAVGELNNVQARLDAAEEAFDAFRQRLIDLHNAASDTPPEIDPPFDPEAFEAAANRGKSAAATIEDALKQLHERLVASRIQSSLIGDSYDVASARADAYRGALEALAPVVTDVDARLGNAGLTLTRIADLYGEWTAAVAAAEDEARRQQAIDEIIEGLERQQRELQLSVEELTAYELQALAASDAERTYAAFLARANAEIERRRQIQEQANAAVEQAVEAARSASSSRTAARFQEITRAASAMAQSIADAFIDFATRRQTFLESVRSLVDGILREFVRLNVERSIIGPLQGFFQDFLGGGIPEAPGPISVDPPTLNTPEWARGAELATAAGALTGSAAAIDAAAVTSSTAITTAATTSSGLLTTAATALTAAAGALTVAAGAKGAGDLFGAAKRAIAAGKRAAGGRVTAGSMYWVGERGPEPFIPDRSGVVVSAHRAEAALRGGGAGSETHIYPVFNMSPNMIDTRGGRDFVREQAGAILEVLQRAKQAGML